MWILLALWMLKVSKIWIFRAILGDGVGVFVRSIDSTQVYADSRIGL